jgi:autotransporter-associated beta strand protein
MMLIAFRRLMLFAVLNVVLIVHAQTVTITSGVQKYASLTSTTVNMSGRCELWVTNPATPLSGCTINLNSTDAWLFLPNIKPSVTAASYLGQIKINSASAVADSNCRVVQYGQNGAVVIPHASSFQPLTVFTGPQFSGTATACSQWTYYTGTTYTNISSFRLKRGYQVVLAQSSNGKNFSKCYVAQDGDLEIGVLPATLDKQVQFIYVTPWRWTSKKGIAGDPGIGLLNLNWWYNWNISSSSSRDLEYIAIRQLQYWPGLGQNWQSLGINTVLGYNEPDQANQANMSIATAIGSWGDLLGTGLRVGSPATSDGGPNSWLIPFVAQADAAGLRVDFTCTHYYQSHNPADAAGCASQLYNFLLNIWNNTHRPIWVTEWNNGANWTDAQWPVPTYAQQQACVQAMVNMLESTPFVERYALYNWVEDGRSLVNSSGAVTLAGTVYSNTVSSLSYSQAMPNNGTRGVAEFLFTTNLWDTSGYGNNGLTVGAPAYTTGHNSQASAIALDGANSYAQLPANIAGGSAFTFAAWVYWNGGGNWQRIFDFGNDTSHYLFLTPSSGSGTLRFAINNGSGEQIVQRTGALPSGSWQHVAITLSNNVAVLYLNGSPVVTSNNFSIAPSAFSPAKNYLGKSQFTADPLFTGNLDQVEITDYAMTAAQISALYNSPQFPAYTGGAWSLNGNGNWSTSNNWSSGIVATGACFVADFSDLDIAANRTVTLDSARTIGGLRFGDISGAQTWTLSGSNPLTLDGGGANAPAIAVNQNTATISTPLAGSNGFAKTGNGSLVLNGTNSVGGGLTVSAGTVTVAGGATTFGSGVSSIGYLTGSGSLNMTAGSLATSGEFRVGGSDQSGLQYIATGAVTVANSTLSVGSLTVARGNYLDNTISGTVTLNSGGTLISTNDATIEFAGTGRGRLALNGGTFIIGPAATRWLMVGYYDTGGGEINLTNGNLLLENGSSLKMCRSGNTGSNVINHVGGNITFYSDAGLTLGGGGNLDLSYAGGINSTSIYHLRGGVLTVPQVVSSASTGTRIFNFNGGTLRPTTSGTAFFSASAASVANVRNNGAIVDTTNLNITIGQPLVHSTIAGDSTIDGGLVKNGAGTLTLSGTNTYTGKTYISNGTLILGSTGSAASSTRFVVNNGALLDVSGITGGFTLGAAQTLAGNGAVNGTVSSSGNIAPGQPLGIYATMTLSNAPVLNGTVTLQVDRNNGSPLNDQVLLPSSPITFGGTLNVINSGTALQSGDAFQLFNAAGYNGTFAATNLPALDPGLGWSNSLAANGSIAVVSTVSLVPTNIAMSTDGINLTLSWPADHIGWRLQTQANAFGSGLDTNWTDVPATTTNQIIIPLATSTGSVFFRLVFP